MNQNQLKVTATRLTEWSLAKKMALRTEGKKMVNEPDDEWKRKMIVAEHSPLRMVQYEIFIENVPQYVTVHIARHWNGIEKFVCSQRPDRNSNVPQDRSELSQTALNDMTIVVNAQALINISKVRLCRKASQETRQLWNEVKKAIEEIDPLVAQAMVPSCLYRGFCPEMKSCGMSKTLQYDIARENYMEFVNNNIKTYK